MENVCIRVRFSPIMKKISKNNSKCCLEILPLVTCIENIDKIKWKHKKDKIEYIVPMNYKIIIKKLKPNHDAIKMYYSCVDLLPSSVSRVDIDSFGAIYRVLSDNIILNKDKTDLMALTKMPPIDMKLDNTMIHIRKAINSCKNCNESFMHLNLSNSVLTLNNISENLKSIKRSKTEEYEATENRLSRDTIKNTQIDKSTSTILQNNQIRLKTANLQKCTKNAQNTKLSSGAVAMLSEKIQPIHTKELLVLSNHRTIKETSSIANIIKELNILKNYNNIKRSINKTALSSPHHIINDSFDEEMIISNIRIKPEVRVAKFVEKLEKEIMPLKLILDNIIIKCSVLGIHQNLSRRNPLLGTNVILGSNQIDKRSIHREKSYNRVVYSIVFDE